MSVLLVACLPQSGRAQSVEFFGDFLYWQTTEPVDWVLNTNRLPVDQFVNYETIDFNSVPGFRVGVGREGQWGTKFYYTWLRSRAAHRASGNLTPTFLGGKLALSDAPAGTPPYFDLGQVEAAVDYNVLDWDFYKPAKSAGSLRLRPVFGLKGAWINQAFDSAFQGQWPDAALTKSVTERIRNRFWGIGPKIGLESGWNVWQGEKCKIRFTADFSTAYLLGHWTVTDVADLTTTVDSVPTMSRRLVPIAGREFGALTFQATVGIHLTCRRWSAMAGYELNDWLNQCQLFDDATGPHNNDLLLQGLTARLSFRF